MQALQMLVMLSLGFSRVINNLGVNAGAREVFGTFGKVNYPL